MVFRQDYVDSARRRLEKELATLRQRVLDEQSAFDKMEALYLEKCESFRALDFALVKKEVMLEEQRRLMELSNQAVVGLEERLTLYGGHTDECDSHTTYCATEDNPVPRRGDCTCAWAELEKIVSNDRSGTE